MVGLLVKLVVLDVVLVSLVRVVSSSVLRVCFKFFFVRVVV